MKTTAGDLIGRIAKELSWTEGEVRSFSLQAIRELLPEGSDVRAEVNGLIRSGEYIASRATTYRRG